MNLDTLGNHIKRARKSRSLTAEAVANLAGVDRTWLSKLENGRLAEAGIQKISRVLGVLGLELRIADASPLPTLMDLQRDTESW